MLALWYVEHLVLTLVTCILMFLVFKAAIVLSASVTFLSLPGLDGFTRIAGLGAVLFASLSMAATLVAFFRVKYDLDRAATPTTPGALGGAGTVVGLEGLVSISVSSCSLLFLFSVE